MSKMLIKICVKKLFFFCDKDDDDDDNDELKSTKKCRHCPGYDYQKLLYIHQLVDHDDLNLFAFLLSVFILTCIVISTVGMRNFKSF